MSSLASLTPISPVLSVAAIGALQKLDGLVAPLIPCAMVSPLYHQGTIFVESSGQYLGAVGNAPASLTAPYTSTQTENPATVAFACQRYEKGSPLIPDRVIERSQFPLAEPKRHAAMIGRHLLLQLEARVADMFQGGGFSTANLVDIGGGGVQWSSYATAKPDNDLVKMQTNFRTASGGYGVDADTIIIPQECLDAYRLCIQAQGIAVVTSGAANGSPLSVPDAVARIAGLTGMKVIVAKSRRRTSAPGVALASSLIWTDTIWIGCLDGSASSAGGDIQADAIAALLVTEDGSGMGIAAQHGEIPINVVEGRSSLPDVPGVRLGADLYTDEVRCDVLLGNRIADVLA